MSPPPTVVLGTVMAPELDSQGVAQLGPFDTIHPVELHDGWLPGWSGATAAVAPLAHGRALVVGRQGGPPFLNSEVARIGHRCAGLNEVTVAVPRSIATSAHARVSRSPRQYRRYPGSWPRAR